MITVYNNIDSLYFEASCCNVSQEEWDRLMFGAKTANKRQINKLVKTFLPDLYISLALNYYNPFDYYKTKTHLILVHSAIEYFLKFN